MNDVGAFFFLFKEAEFCLVSSSPCIFHEGAAVNNECFTGGRLLSAIVSMCPLIFICLFIYLFVAIADVDRKHAPTVST